jgi:hypothetical protein
MKKILITILFCSTIYPSNPQQLANPMPPVVQPQFYQNYPGMGDYEPHRLRRIKPMRTSKIIAISAVTSLVTSCFTCLLLTKVRW